MSDLALGIDIGTSGIRVAALAADGTLQAGAAASHAEIGEDHRAPQVWADALRLALDRLGQTVALGRIGAVAVDGTSGSVLGLDRSGGPVGGALMYNDAVSDPDIPTRIAAWAPAASAAHGPASALARALVLQDRPGVIRIAHQADWIAGLLAGAPLPGDESNALKTGYDPVARRWPDWIGETGLAPTLLPEIVPAGAATGVTSGAFGLPRDAVLVAGVTDGCASFLATGAAQPGDGVTALGTTLTIKLLSDRPVFAPEYGIYSHRIGDIWLAGGASNSGGGVLAQVFSPERIAELSSQIDPASDSGFDYYPLPSPGERFPVSDPHFQPRMTPRPEEDAAYLHGLLEGIARIEALGYRRLAELGAPALAALYSVGGGAENDTWSALRRRITGVAQRAAASTQACAGVARLALPHLSR
ncbi:MAG: FGGY-family carbohydrate kinase [Albidovulum sp.]|uniref:FGGY-family carbohydrate kinase n=1 Tax=Albidovulum sp. TaxID=1872424 RepID=UPI003CBA5F15